MPTQNQIGNINQAEQSIGLISLQSVGTFNATTTFAEVAGFGPSYSLSSGVTSDFVMTTNGRLTYIGGTSRKFNFYDFVTPQSTSASALSAGVAIGVNGTVITGSRQYGFRNSSICYAIPCSEISVLNTNDYISLFLAVSSGTETYTIYGAQLSAVSAYGG